MIRPNPTTAVAEHSSFDQFDEGEWDALVERTGGDIRLTHAWCRTWWEHYGGSRALHIFSTRPAGQLGGVLPLLLDRVRLGPVSLRVARIVGSDFTPGIYNPPIDSSLVAPLITSAAGSLLSAGACDVICLGPLSAGLPGFAALHEAVARERPEFVLARDASVGVHMHVQLPSTFDEYLASLSKQQRKSYRRKWRDLTAAHTTREEIVADPGDELPAAFEAMVELHARQWQARGAPGHFGDWPSARAFHRDVVAQQARCGRSRLVNMFCDDTLVGARYAYLLGGRWYAWLSARRVGAPWDDFSLGNVGLVRAISSAIDAGATWMDLGTGYYEHKTLLGARQDDVRSLVLVRRDRLTPARLRWFGHFADLLHILYHKIWFRRAARYAPWTRGPLWPTWIRSRL